jgi:hypothetical protein
MSSRASPAAESVSSLEGRRFKSCPATNVPHLALVASKIVLQSTLRPVAPEPYPCPDLRATMICYQQ